MRIKTVTIGLVLAGTALASTALTLGRARGAAWIGQPLDLQITVQRDPSDTDSSLCAEADVFHGESRQDGGRVQIQTEAGPTADSVNLRVTSPAPIDEPVVSVYLSAGCGKKVTRKYVLLADFPTEPQSTSAWPSPVAPVTIDVATLAPAPDSQPIAPTAIAGPAPAQSNTPPPEIEKKSTVSQPKATAEAALRKDLPKKKVNAPPARAKPKTSQAANKAATPGTGKPRLRLDPVETLAERIKILEAVTTQTSMQEELSRDAQKMQQLQSDLRTLLDQAVKNEATLAAMRERLEKAEADRAPIALVYALIALVALSLAALAYLWVRKGNPVQWGESSASNRGDAFSKDGAGI